MAAALGVVVGASACGTTEVPPGPDATHPVCAEIVLAAPEQMLDLDRRETNSQSTVSWGSGEDTIVMRCGAEPPPPTSEMCTRLADDSGLEVDWIVSEEDGIVHYTTYGREPAIDITVPRSVAPDQPSAVALDLAGLVSMIPATAYCVGPGDVQ